MARPKRQRFRAHLQDAGGGGAAFDQRHYVEWIAEAKRPDTRTRRVAETVERVQNGGPRS